MLFPLSGVEVSPLVPLVVGFVLASLTTPVGVSGAFLLLPFQVSVLGFTGPGVTPTNLLFNVFSTPGGISRYRRQGSVDWALVRGIVTGAVPGIVLGSVLRVSVFAEPTTFKAFVGATLFLLGLHLVAAPAGRRRAAPKRPLHPRHIWLLAGFAGTVGGIYGISGGSIIAPALASVFGVSVTRVAPAALIATLITSVAGVASFMALASGLGPEPGAAPDWLLGGLFGLGGIAGSHLGARLHLRVPERGLRALLGVLACLLGASYVASVL